MGVGLLNGDRRPERRNVWRAVIVHAAFARGVQVAALPALTGIEETDLRVASPVITEF